MMTLSRSTRALLESIEERIDPETEDDYLQQWRDFLFDRFDGTIFTPRRKKISSHTAHFPPININDAIADYETMLASQLELVSQALAEETQAPCVRCNYGSAIMSSVFGAEIFTMPRETNTLPTTRALNGTDCIRELLDRGIPSLDNGFGARVFEMGELFAEVFAQYPKIQKYVSVYHPDTQGPLDICELLWGGEMFYALYDEPELVHDMLDLASRTYIEFLEKWYRIFPNEGDVHAHWTSMMHRGSIVLRNDSAMNLSPQMYKEFAAPYDARLLQHFGGGVIHFCGKGSHYIGELAKIPQLYGINLSQPHLNDMEEIYKNTVDCGIRILDFGREHALADRNRDGAFHHCLHAN